MIIEERVSARAGLLGNPSDGYFGKTISISVKNFGAHVSLYETPELCIEPNQLDVNKYHNISSLIEQIQLHGYYGGDRLIKAAIKKFVEYCRQENIELERKNFTIRYHSTIPRQVGLAGSSAIITSVIKALMKFYNVDIHKQLLPTIILKAEVDELGITAGLQDRVIQVYGGCVYMDFDKKHMDKKQYGRYEYIEPKIMSHLYIAYKTGLSKVSGVVLQNIKARFDSGEPEVIEVLKQIAFLAETGKELVTQGSIAELNGLINQNFDLRCKIMNISKSNIEMVQTARACGASAKLTGSGGSIIGLFKNDDMLTKLIIDMKNINARVIKPYLF